MSKLLSKLAVPTRTITVEYPKFPEFKLDLKFVSREISRQISKEAQKLRLDNDNLELDDNLFNLVYSKHAFSGWKGLTFKVLSNFVLLNEDEIEDMDEELEFSYENAAFLLGASKAFEDWVNKVVFDIDQFRIKKST